jgi:hypothetical protein
MDVTPISLLRDLGSGELGGSAYGLEIKSSNIVLPSGVGANVVPLATLRALSDEVPRLDEFPQVSAATGTRNRTQSLGERFSIDPALLRLAENGTTTAALVKVSRVAESLIRDLGDSFERRIARQTLYNLFPNWKSTLLHRVHFRVRRGPPNERSLDATTMTLRLNRPVRRV